MLQINSSRPVFYACSTNKKGVGEENYTEIIFQHAGYE